MPNDFITIKALVSELSQKLISGRINKINMPTSEEIHISVRAEGQNKTLIFSSQAPIPRLYLTSAKAESQDIPPLFCMILRKNITGAIIESLETYNNDRIAVMTVIGKNELHDCMRYRLIIELMGNASNIILTDENYVVIEGVRRLLNEGNRCVYPHLRYIPPEQNKTNICSEKDYSKLDLSATDLDMQLTSNYVGLSKETAKEIATIAKQTNDIKQVVNGFCNVFNTNLFKPCILLDENDVPKGYFIFPYTNTIKGRFIQKNSLNDALDDYYSNLAKAEAKQRNTKRIRQTIKKLISKCEKKMEVNHQKLLQCAKKEDLLQQGEILKCNMHLLKNNCSEIEVYDFYNDKNIVIKLDEKLSAKRNVENFFKKYTKMKGAEIYATKEKEELKEYYEYLKSIEESIELCDSKDEFAEIEKEIDEITGKSKVCKKNKKEKPSAPIELTVESFKVFIGKNNMQNDMITFKLCQGRDLWMHAKDAHGSHAVIITNGAKVDDKIIKKVAEFTAWVGSKGKPDKIAIDYTYKKNVKRLGKPGLVSYTDYKTVYVLPTKPIEIK